MISRTRIFLLTLALLGAAATCPAPAQMVPRLVPYVRPATIASPCASEAGAGRSERRTLAYARGRWDETLAVFAGPGCAPEAALFTLRLGGTYDPVNGAPWNVAFRTMTTTVAGSAYLQEQCGASAWEPGVVHDVTGATCTLLATIAAP